MIKIILIRIETRIPPSIKTSLAPDGILKAIEILHPEANILYVGDNPTDIEAGINARVKTCDVMYSEKFEECEKLNPNYCVKDLMSIISILGE